MLPGKKYTPEDILFILRQRFWLLVLPTVIIGAGASAWARRLPDLYRAEAIIQVQPPRVPEQYVRTIATRVEDRVYHLRNKVMARTKLEGIIIELNLYPEIRRTSVMEDAVERMRAELIWVPRGDLLTVGFYGRDPATVKMVADKMSELVISESTRDRETLTEGTDQFIESTLDDVRRRLEEKEKALADYRLRYRNELPQQTEGNIQAIQNVQMQIRQVLDSLNNAQERRLTVEKFIQDLETQTEVSQTLTTGPAATTTAGQQLAQAQQDLNTLLRTLQPIHPTVKALKQRIAELEKKAEAEALEAPVSPSSPISTAEQTRVRRIQTAKDELAQINKQIVQYQQAEEELRKRSGVIEANVNAAPTRETEMIELTRDYNQIAATYSSYLAKREETKIAATLERRSLGSQLKVLDFARRPLRPYAPNRRIYTVGGLAVGFGFGALVVLLLEYRDRSFKTDDDITSVIGLPVLAVVPLMQSKPERRRNMRKRWVVGLGLGTTVAGCLAVLLYTVIR